VKPPARPHWRGMPRRAQARLRGGGKAHGRSDDAKHAGPFKVTRAVRSMVLIGPESVPIGSDRSVRVEKAKRERAITGPRSVGIAVTKIYSRFVPPYDVAWIEDKLEGIRGPNKDFEQAPVASTL
jgi:hypothetical protein